ncbi:bile acid:sodium symporter [Cephaloticoccus capnophilus]|uniref:Bile acid:sodium symporter n=1 Tax=Cephaloticoccus capnophilus TaxID=1548208 RepID=A0A139SQM5_9BACT|nr:bile acid:sodium symporter family protein [Cephaloticoccus capnophilus]KXU36751.1 bile acid:sodium symporter [Cephaloticoccus capnophilus]
MRVPKLDWFLIGMGLAALLAWAVPGPGASGGWLRPEFTVKAGVALIFLLHGLLLSFAALRAGALSWRVHLVVQGCTFLFFPLLGLALLPLLEGVFSPELRLGIFFVCVLPSTVSSSVAMTAAAGGNVPVAVCNATLSSLIGVVLTPLGMSVVTATTGQPIPLGEVIWDLVVWMVLPLAAGQVLRPVLGSLVQRHKAKVNLADRLVILLLVYTSFCESVRRDVWTGQSPWALGGVALVALGLFFAAMAAVRLVCRWAGMPREDEIAAIFCGSKKTLAAGVPMAQLIFGATPALGLILLPIIVYHQLQLLVCSVLASRWAKRG